MPNMPIRNYRNPTNCEQFNFQIICTKNTEQSDYWLSIIISILRYVYISASKMSRQHTEDNEQLTESPDKSKKQVSIVSRLSLSLLKTIELFCLEVK